MARPPRTSSKACFGRAPLKGLYRYSFCKGDIDIDVDVVDIDVGVDVDIDSYFGSLKGGFKLSLRTV